MADEMTRSRMAVQWEVTRGRSMPLITGGRFSSGDPDPALQEARKQLARMISLRGYDPLLVEDDIFRSFVGSLNPRFEVPSRRDIEEMCDDIFDDATNDIFSRLWRLRTNDIFTSVSPPRPVSLAVSKVKTMEKQLLYLAYHFIDDEWNLHKMVLGALVESHGPCDGPILGIHVFHAHRNIGRDVFDHISISHDLVSMVATDNDIQPQLKEWIERLTRREMHCTTFVDNVLHSIARCLLPDISFTWEMVEGLQLTRRERQQRLSHLGPDYQWAYDEQWYLCFCSLLIQKKGSDSSLLGNSLENLLCKIWGRIHRAIQAISASSCPTSNLYLAELFKLRDTMLQSEQDCADICDESEYGNDQFKDGKNVADVLREALETLDKAIQDSYLAWSVPLVLDPRYKFRYIKFSFERAYGPEAKKYISEVMTMMKKLYNDHSGHSTTAVADLEQEAWNEHCRSQDLPTGPETELDRYLGDRLSPQTQGFDVLSWWKVHSLEYPTVARMARVALAMPTCSKLSSEQMARVRSIIRGYSKSPYYERDALE